MSYDLIIIGSGPAGYPAAVRAGQYGLKTAIIEKRPKLGGTCLHVGCVPTKALLHSAEVWNHFRHAAELGVIVENPKLNYSKMVDIKNDVVEKNAKGVDYLMKKNKAEVIKGYGRLLGKGKVEVTADDGSKKTLEAKAIIVATGSEARMLPGLEPDAEKILTNIEILNLREVPKSLAVVGAGAVGMEFASMFNRFGTEVAVFEMLPSVVAKEDEEVSKEMLRVFKKQGVRVEVGCKLAGITRTKKGVKFEAEYANGKKETLEYDKLLVAVGRRPNTENIGFENTRVELDRGFVKVNGYMETGEPGLYAVGDIIAGYPQLAHAGTMEAVVAVGRIAGKPVTPIRADRIPNATYTEPGIGSVGLTEAEAKSKGYDVKVGKFPFVANSKAKIMGQPDGFVKVVSDAKYGEILGVHIIGPLAYELIAEAVTAMDAEATVDTMMSVIHAHPTLYEAVGEAFHAVHGMPINA
ncbi:MAG: dihydrolipoyl dehydrogenase [Bryobacterales bacterium]|nr:dihydrolipoyl dehydrogenase [Bryobacterales bacterium]